MLFVVHTFIFKAAVCHEVMVVWLHLGEALLCALVQA